MDNSIYASLSGQVALRRKLDTVANNMANLATTGYKAERVHFADVYARLETDGKGVAFVQDVSSTTDFTQGGLTQTGNDLDVAMSGNGLLGVQTQAGETLYTRDGRFARDAQGMLVLTGNGMRVMDNAGAGIQIPADVTQITIGGDGTVSSPEGGIIGKIGLFQFDPMTVTRLAEGLFKSETPLEPSTDVRVTQGFLENSNVNAVRTLTEMIEVQRAYETGSNLISREDERIKDAIARLGREPR